MNYQNLLDVHQQHQQEQNEQQHYQIVMYSINGIKMYACNCGRTYSYEGNLKYHLKYCYRNKMVCPNCGKTFKDHRYYPLHIKRCKPIDFLQA